MDKWEELRAYVEAERDAYKKASEDEIALLQNRAMWMHKAAVCADTLDKMGALAARCSEEPLWTVHQTAVAGLVGGKK